MRDDGTIRLAYDVMGRFLLHRGAEPPIPVRPVRLFPLSDPEGYILLLDHEEKEVTLIRNMKELDPASRQALRQELETAYIVPEVLCIESIEEEFGVLHFVAVTDRGPHRFDVRGRGEIQFVRPGYYIIRDIDGNRFEIPNLFALDARSLALLDPYL
jgi:hypothetical protein